MTDRAPSNEGFREAVYDRLKDVDPPAAFRYGICGKEGHGWFYHCPDNDAHFAKYVPASCMLRICPDCSDKMAGRVRDRYRLILSEITDRFKWRKWSLKLVTLTRRVGLNDDPGGVARQVMDDSAKLYKRLWGKTAGAGMISTLEVGENGHKYHTHNIIWGPFIWKSEEAERAHVGPNGQLSGGPYISETWEAMTGDPVVDVSAISVDKAVREGLKYVTKFTNLSPDLLVKLHMALKGTRRLRSFGVFYNPKIDEPEVESVVQCPDCGAPLVYHSELEFEKWRSESSAARRAREFAILSSLAKGGSLLDLTGANKSPPIRGSPAQINYFDGSESHPEPLFDDLDVVKKPGKP